MPVLDGISAAEMIGRERIAPVVMLTAFSQKELVERARDAGAMAYVVKPFTASDLVPAIEIARSPVAEITPLEAEVADLGERFETRKAVDRAKGVLMAQLRSPRRRRSAGSRRRPWTGAWACVRSPRRSSRACRHARPPTDRRHGRPAIPVWSRHGHHSPQGGAVGHTSRSSVPTVPPTGGGRRRVRGVIGGIRRSTCVLSSSTARRSWSLHWPCPVVAPRAATPRPAAAPAATRSATCRSASSAR